MTVPSIPGDAHLVRTTDELDADTVPAGLLRAHRIADGVWGRIVVRAGTVQLVFEDDDAAPVTVAAGGSTIVPPERRHHVVLGEGARFVIEFHKV